MLFFDVFTNKGITINKSMYRMSSLVMTQGSCQDNLGIYIKSIVKGGPAEIVRTFDSSQLEMLSVQINWNVFIQI